MDRLIREAGLVCAEMTRGIAHPELLKNEVFIVMGNRSLRDLGYPEGIPYWRGSMLDGPNGSLIIPTYGPGDIISDWSLRATVLHDLRRAVAESHERTKKPEWKFIIEPSFGEVLTRLESFWLMLCWPKKVKLSYDIETANGHVLCIGVAWSSTEALCIPFVRGTEPYWDEAQEAEIIFSLYRIMTHPNFLGIGQNLLFDDQYIAKRWGFRPRHHLDTMIASHTMFSSQPKSLDHLASLHCSHFIQWKERKRFKQLKEED